jgi:hypothetical protein
MKLCRTCKLDLPLTSFRIPSSTKKPMATCRACIATKGRAYQADPEVRKATRARARRTRAERSAEGRERRYQRHTAPDDGIPKLYFIQTTSGAIKIGHTMRTAAGRLQQLLSGTCEELTLLAWFPAPRTMEVEVHDRFRHLWITREWFKPGEDLLLFIANLPPQG